MQTGYYRYSPPVSYQKASWAVVESISMLITEDLQSIAAKGAWAKAGNCGGTIVWTINYGYVDAAVGNPPMQAVKQAFLETSTPYTLTVAKAGTGSGTVTSSPAGISCGADCSEPYNSGTVVTLSQTATAGSTFAGWSGACTGTGACQVTMDAAKSVTATFTLNARTYPHRREGRHRQRHRHLLSRRHQLRRRLLRALQLRNRRHPQPDRRPPARPSPAGAEPAPEPAPARSPWTPPSPSPPPSP